MDNPVLFGVVLVVSTVMSVALVALPIVLVVQAVRPLPARFCTRCGTEGPPVRTTRGSLLVEVAAWCLFLIPGVIYSCWRLTTRTISCRACGSSTLVPPESPVARQMKASLPPPPPR